MAENLRRANVGDIVTFHYRLTDGEQVVEDTFSDDCMEMTLGDHDLIPGIEQSLVTMTASERKTFILNPEQVFGAVNNELVFELDKSKLPASYKMGDVLEADFGDAILSLKFIREKLNTVILDGNHPLAGRDLRMDLHLLSIR